MFIEYIVKTKMRAFLVLLYAVCLVVARPQDGYNYEPSQGFQQQLFSAPLVQRAQSFAPIAAAYSAQPQLQSFQQYPSVAAPIAHSYAAQSQFVPLPLPQPTTSTGFLSHGSYAPGQDFVAQPNYVPQTVSAPHFPATYNGFNAQSLQTEIQQAPLTNAALTTDLHASTASDFGHHQSFASHLTHDVSHVDATTSFVAPSQQTPLAQFEAFRPIPTPEFVAPSQQTPLVQTETFAPSPTPTMAAPSQEASLTQTETFGPSPADIAPAAPTQTKIDSQSISVEVPETPAPLALDAPTATAPTQPAQLFEPVQEVALPETQPRYQDTQPRYQEPQSAPIQTTTIHKHIYVHVPPPDFEEPEPQPLPQQPIVKHNKHYKIIFIKAPALPQARFIAPQINPLNEEKTLVYVLVKKPEHAHEILQPVEQPEPIREKPEVYFIKYSAKKETIPAALPTLPAAIESPQLNENVVVDARANPPQFPALEEQNALDQPEDVVETNEETAVAPQTSVNDELSASAELPSLELSKKYIPAE